MASGLHDVHTHPLEASNSIGGTCRLKKDTKPTQDIFLDPNCAANQLGTNWILGHGFSISAFMSYLQSPTELAAGGDPRIILDRIFPDRPAIMMEETSHSVWVNSAALKIAGLDGENPPNWIGTKVMVNASNYANGVLLESAGKILLDLAFDPVKYPLLRNVSFDALIAGLETLAKNGLTLFVDARNFYRRGNHESFQRAENENLLNSRAVLSLWAYPNDLTDDKQIQDLMNLFCDPPSGNLKRTQVKVYKQTLPKYSL